MSGTSEYLAPEMIAGGGHDEGVDWWQMGIVLCEMLTGKHPFYHRNLYRLQQNILHRTPHLDAALSPEARSLLLGLLSKEPAQRLGRVAPTLDHNGVMVMDGDVERHPFFAKHRINWVTVESRQATPGWVPPLRDAKDVSHFDAQFTGQTPSDTPESYSEQHMDDVRRKHAAGAVVGSTGATAARQMPGGGGKGAAVDADAASSPSPALQGGYAFYTAAAPAATTATATAYDGYGSGQRGGGTNGYGAGHGQPSSPYQIPQAAPYSPKQSAAAFEATHRLPPPLLFAGATGVGAGAGGGGGGMVERSQSPTSALTQQLAIARQSSAGLSSQPHSRY